MDGDFGAIRYDGGEWISIDTSLQQQDAWRSIHFLDVNGDGLPDAVYTGFGCPSQELVQHPCIGEDPFDFGGFPSDVPFLSINDGKAFSLPGGVMLTSPASPGNWADWYGDEAVPIDYDGDGRMDLMMLIPGHCGPGSDPEDPCWVVLQSSPLVEGIFKTVNALPTTGYATAIDTHIPWISGSPTTLPSWFLPQVTDVNADGRHDIVVPDPADGGTFVIYRSSGPQDLLTAVFDGTNPLGPKDPAALPNVAIHYGNLVDEAVTKGIAESALGHDDLTYVAHQDPANGCAFPRACVVGAERVVRSYVVNDGQNEGRWFYVKYRDGRYHREGRGFLGFGERIVIDGDTAGGMSESYDNITHEATFDTFPFAGQVVRSRTWSATKPHWLDPGQVEMTFSQRSLLLQPTNQGGTFFTLPVSTSFTREEGTMAPGSGKSVLRFVKAAEATPLLVVGQSSSEVLDYDALGNVLHETAHADGVDLESDVSRTYDDDPATWLIGRLATEVACSTALAMTQCRSTQLLRDGDGEVKSATLGDPADLGTHLAVGLWRDPFGNVTLATAEDAFDHGRSSCVTYDAEHLFPYATGDALGHLTYTRFDPGLGVRTAAVDANGLPTRWQHDAFGSVTEELRADGTKSIVALQRTKDGGPQGKWFNAKVTTKEDGGLTSTTELDALGRPVHVWTLAAEVPSCGATTCAPTLRLEEETRYDHLGRITRATLPWISGDALSGKVFNAYEYDAAGRLTRHTEPWGRVTSYGYAGRVASVTDWLGTSATEVDGLARLVKATDKKGYTTETAYGPFGATWAVKRTGGETTQSERDAYGRVVREVDPDRGTTHLTYDGFGEALTTDDALSRHYAFTYDALGRLVQRDDADGTVRWAYDTAPHGIGRLASVTNAASVKQYAYDALSRPEMVALTLTDTGDVFHAGFGYDAEGRLQIIAYPQVAGVDPLVLRREYDIRGNLVAVHDNTSGATYWRLQGLDGAGRPEIEKLGSGVSMYRDHDPESGLVRHIMAGKGAVPGSGTIQDLVYGYDKSLRLVSRADQLQVGPKGVRAEVFAHDALGRLGCTRFADVPAGLAAPGPQRGRCATSITYAPSGNITSKSDVGAYTYDPGHPHAVMTAGAGSYEYDAVGNQISRPDAEVAYTAFDLPSVVTPSGGEGPVSFTYDGDQRRIRKQGAGQETVYFEDLYERVGGGASGGAAHRYYVGAGSATVVLTRQVGGNDKVAYLHADALGSTDVVTDGSGNVAGSAGERRSYDAFGARRSAAWGQPAPAGGFASKASPMGFTGHEGDDELGLINMRGRIYDPRLGRFLSTDPVVSRPQFGQSWNPYSYVLNSPLNFVDPSGFEDRPADCGNECMQWPDGKFYRVVSVKRQPGDDGSTKVRYSFIEVRDAVRDDATAPPGGGAAASGDQGTAAKVVSGVATGYLDHMQDSFFPSIKDYLRAMAGVTIVDNAIKGGRDDGAIGAAAGIVNTVNPLYAFGVRGANVDLKVQAGDTEGAARESTRLVLAVGTAGVALLAGVESTPAASAGAAEGTSLVARVSELRAAIPAAQKGRITMAVGLAEDAGGVQQVLIGTSEGGFFRKGVPIGTSEVRVSGTGHAEANVVSYAQAQGLRLLEVGATRPICASCAKAILGSGARAVTPLKE